MKKITSFLLIFLFTVQNAAPAMAQSSPEFEAKELSECMNGLFSELQIFLSKETGENVILSNDQRIYNIKSTLEVLWSNHFKAMTLINRSALALSIVFFSTVVYGTYYKKPGLVKQSAELKKFLKVNEFNGVELAKKGGTASIEAQIANIEEIISQSKMVKWSRKLYPIALTFGILVAAKLFVDSMSTFFARPAFKDISLADTEDKLYSALATDGVIINELRKKALKNCKASEIFTAEEKQNLFMRMAQELSNPTPIPPAK